MLKLKDCILLINQIHVSVQIKLLFITCILNTIILSIDYCKPDPLGLGCDRQINV